MPKLQYLSLCIIPLAAACDGSDEPVSVTVSTSGTPMAIAFRDGLDAEWQVPTPSAAGSYKLEPHGPYMVSVVCGASDGSLVTTRQIARTPEDGRELDMKCPEAPAAANATIKGKMAKAGSAALGNKRIDSATADWDFSFQVAAGTFDLIGVSDQKITLKRDIAVAANATNDLGLFDVDQAGVALVPAALTASNAVTAEQLEAQVLISTASTSAGRAYAGAPADAKIAPNELVTGNVRQSVLMVAKTEDASRSVRRDFRSGDAASFKLPDPIAGAKLETVNGELVASWTGLPEHDQILVSMSGTLATDKIRKHELSLSKSFVAETGATRVTLDTDMPGHQATWRADLAREHTRALTATREAAGEQLTSSLSKTVPAQQ